MRKVLTDSSYEVNLGAFDACVKSGIGSAKLVGLDLLFDSPSPVKSGVPYEPISPRRVSCSLSAVAASTGCIAAGQVFLNPGTTCQNISSDVDGGCTQRTEASPCAVRTRDRAFRRHEAITVRRNMVGPSLEGAGGRDTRGQKTPYRQSGKQTPAPRVGAVVFFSSLLTFMRLEQSLFFLGGPFFVFHSSLPFFYTFIRDMNTWAQVQISAKQAGFQNYQDYLDSPHWLNLKRQKPASHCSACESGIGLVRHHVRYKNLIDVTPDDLVVLCRACHDDFHMGCRHFKFDYINVELSGIAEVVTEFRKTAFYAKWIARKQRKASKRALCPNGFNPKSYGKMLKRRFVTVMRKPTRQNAEEFCKWLLEKIPA